MGKDLLEPRDLGAEYQMSGKNKVTVEKTPINGWANQESVKFNSI